MLDVIYEFIKATPTITEVISFETHNLNLMEKSGDPGREPELVKVYDFVDEKLGKVNTPIGVYDQTANGTRLNIACLATLV